MFDSNLLRKIFLSLVFFYVLSCFFAFPQNAFADGTIYLPGYPISPPRWNAPGVGSTSDDMVFLLNRHYSVEGLFF